MKDTKFTYEYAVARIDQLKGKPIAVEAQWDGDTQGWFLMMFVILKIKKGFWQSPKIDTQHLGNLSLGDDLRLFNGTVPPYPEAALANEIGKKLEKKYGLEFFFPSPINPDDNCPRWTERHKAINCADCDKQIIPTDSPYLPKDICYNCHLKREQNERIKTEKPHDDGVNVYFSNRGKLQKLGYASKFESFPIAEFVENRTENTSRSYINILQIKIDQIESISKKLERKIDKELENYEVPQIEESMSKFVKTKTVIYKNLEYELMERFNEHHRDISRLIHSYNQTIQALEENYEYHIYFKNGFTYRDDSFLRFVNFVEKGCSTIKGILENYNVILSELEVKATVNKLVEMDCLRYDGENILITELGKNIL